MKGITNAKSTSLVTSVVGQTGAVTASQIISAILTGNENYGDKIVAKQNPTSKTSGVHGWIKYQSGLIIQYGYFLVQSTQNARYTYDTPFATDDVFIILDSGNSGRVDGTEIGNANPFSTFGTDRKTGFNINRYGGISNFGKVNYIAIGK